MQASRAYVLPKWADTAVVLGGGMTRRGKLNHDAKTRVRKAFSLWKQGIFKRFLLTGGKTNEHINKSEAVIMREWLVKKGVPLNAITLEEKALDTLGNAVYSKPLLKNKHVLLITSDYHLARSLDLFTHILGEQYSVYGIASHPFFVHRFPLWLRERQLKGVTDFILRKVKPGDDKSAKKILKQIEKLIG